MYKLLGRILKYSIGITGNVSTYQEQLTKKFENMTYFVNTEIIRILFKFLMYKHTFGQS